MTAGKLVVVGTPIGNLGDLAPRAVEVLRTADVVAAEDTRRARALLSAAGVPARGRLVSVHAHNEGERAARLVDRALDGAVVAVVSDAGMPGISDPGAALVRAAAAAGVPVEVVPGPSAVLAALAVSGLPSDRFAFEGFLPRRGRSRDRRLAGIAASDRTVVVFESPRRVPGTLADLARVCGPGRPVVVARELTKLHEEVWRGSAREAAARAAAGGEPRRARDRGRRCHRPAGRQHRRPRRSRSRRLRRRRSPRGPGPGRAGGRGLGSRRRPHRVGGAGGGAADRLRRGAARRGRDGPGAAERDGA